jgi:hypothetical protein
MSERYTPPECGPTHHLGCKCREANLADQIDTLRTALAEAEKRAEAITRAAERADTLADAERALDRARAVVEACRALRDAMVDLRERYQRRDIVISTSTGVIDPCAVLNGPIGVCSIVIGRMNGALAAYEEGN